MNAKVEVNPTIHFGKPCVAGKRVPVVNVLELVRDGVSPEQICADFYPDLTREDVVACLQYTIDVIAARSRSPRRKR